MKNRNLIASISECYAVSSALVVEVLNLYNPNWREQNVGNLHELLAAYPDKVVQLEYAFSTTLRGVQLVKYLEGIGVIAKHSGKKILMLGVLMVGF